MTLLALLSVSASRRTLGGNVVRAFSTIDTSTKGTCFHTGTSIPHPRTARTPNALTTHRRSSGWYTTAGFSTESNPSHSSNSIVATAATVEDDLDSALDDILGSVFKEAGDPIIDSFDQAIHDAVDGAADLSVRLFTFTFAFTLIYILYITLDSINFAMLSNSS